MNEMLILVDHKDNEIGIEEKMKVHHAGQLHRAFSIFIFNKQGEMLLQQRASQKYHSGGLWSNACCSHPRTGEEVEQAAHRRLLEELGFDCHLEKLFDFIYKKALCNGLTEHEFDHVFKGEYDNVIQPDPQEVQAYKWISIAELLKDLDQHPDNYTEWFKIALNRVIDAIAKI